MQLVFEVLGIRNLPKSKTSHTTSVTGTLNKTTKQRTQLQKEKGKEECGDGKVKLLLNPFLLWGGGIYSRHTKKLHKITIIQANGNKCSKMCNTPKWQPYPQAHYTTTNLYLEGALLFCMPTLALGLPPQLQLQWQEVKPITLKKEKRKKK